MKRIITLTESDLTRIVRQVLNEQSGGDKLNDKGRYILKQYSVGYNVGGNTERTKRTFPNEGGGYCKGISGGSGVVCNSYKNNFPIKISCNKNELTWDADNKAVFFNTPKYFAEKIRSMFCCGGKVKPDNYLPYAKAFDGTHCKSIKNLELKRKDNESKIVNNYKLNDGVFYLNEKNVVTYKSDYMGKGTVGGYDKQKNGKCRMMTIGKKNVIRCQWAVFDEGKKRENYFDISCADDRNHAFGNGHANIQFTKPTDFAQKMRKLFCPSTNKPKTNKSTNKSKTIKINPSEEEKCYLADDKTWSYATKNKRWYASKDGKNWIDITNNSKAVKILTDPVKGCKNIKEITSFVPPTEIDFVDFSSDIPSPKD